MNIKQAETEAEDLQNKNLLRQALLGRIHDIPQSLHTTMCEVLTEEVRRLELELKEVRQHLADANMALARERNLRIRRR